MRHSESVEGKRSVGPSSLTIIVCLGEEQLVPSESVDGKRSVGPSSLTMVIPFSLLQNNVWGRRRYDIFVRCFIVIFEIETV